MVLEVRRLTERYLVQILGISLGNVSHTLSWMHKVLHSLTMEQRFIRIRLSQHFRNDEKDFGRHFINNDETSTTMNLNQNKRLTTDVNPA